MCACGRIGAPHPPFLFVLFCYTGVTEGLCCKGVVWGLCGVVDIGDEFVVVLTITAAHVRCLCVAWTL